ncbi:MAG: amidohydrolase family protein [Deltaproteobacteria bacterium]|nr:MAG: amidohydrolase family protein [Deltaproteobacteria bacterium]
MYDLLIKDTVIYDGNGGPGLPGHLAVQGERIATVSGKASGKAKRTIKGNGLAVCPGFVDIHGHSDYQIIINPQAESKVRQGVTTEIAGNCGSSAAPIWGEAAEERKKSAKKIFGLEPHWKTLREYHQELIKEGISINFGSLIGQGNLRSSVMGGKDSAPAEEELHQMTREAEAGMKEGAFGISAGLFYPPGCFTGLPELVALGKVARQYYGIFAFHLRSEGKEIIEALGEALKVGKEADIPLQISHLKLAERENWDKIDAVFSLIEGAQAEGIRVSCDCYPYPASHTVLTSILPKWAVEGGREKMLSRLKKPEEREKIKEDISRQHPADYWESVVISQVFWEENRKYEGQKLSQAASSEGKETLNFTLDLLCREEGRVTAIYFNMSEENLKRIIRRPYCMVGSDAALRADHGVLSQGRPHPRAYGTFPRVLSKYVREEGILDLGTAIRKMTLDPCRKLGIRERGELKAGNFADIVIFDPLKIEDRASYLEPRQYPRGIEYVIVNGKITVEEGKHTGERGGRILTRT